MQRFFKKIVMVVLLAGFQGVSAAKLDPEVRTAANYAFVQVLMHQENQIVHSCADLKALFAEAASLGIDERDVSALVRQAVLNKYEQLNKSKILLARGAEAKELTDVAKIYNLIMTCRNN